MSKLRATTSVYLRKAKEPAEPDPGPDWTMAGGLPELSSGGTVVKRVGGRAILFLKIQDILYGYRPICPSCESSLADGPVNGTDRPRLYPAALPNACAHSRHISAPRIK